MTLMRWQPMNEMVDLSELFNRSFQRNGNGQLEPSSVVELKPVGELPSRCSLPNLSGSSQPSPPSAQGGETPASLTTLW